MKSILLLTLLLSLNLNAEEKGNKPLEQKPSLWEHETKNMLSPITTPAVWVMAAGSVLTYLAYKDAKDKGEIGYDKDHKEGGGWKEWGNILGWGVYQIGYTLTQIPGINRGEKRALENTEIMWKSTLYTGLTTLAFKIGVKQERRNSEGKYESFPSGHASAAFAFATNVALRHEWYWNFISVPLALFATSARVAEDAHYVHDSIFGATLGISFALGMNYISDDVPFVLGYEPMEDGGGVVMKYTF